mgnify:CR=1 FL=1
MNALVLKQGREKSVKRRHPWIFSGAIERVVGKPNAGDTVQVRSADGAPGRLRIALPVWDRTSPLASRIMAPTTSETSPSPPALTAPSRNCVSSGLSSVRTPYLALKARLLAT